MSGLAAAWRLQQADFEVTVLERQRHPGGHAQSVQRDGYLIDIGPDAMTTDYVRYQALLADCGLADRVVSCSPVIGLVRRGRIIDIDPRRVWSLPFTPALSVRGKLGLLRGARAVMRDAASLPDTYRLIDTTELDDPFSDAERYSVARFGREVTDYLIDPALRLTTATRPARVSALSVPVAAANWASQLINVTGGMGMLPHALAERLDVRLGTTVTRVSEAAGERVVVEHDGGEPIACDACVIAAMYHDACAFWEPLKVAAPTYEGALENVKLISISLGYDTTARSKAYTVLVPTREHKDAMLIFFQQHKASDRVPPGHSLVTLYTDSDSTDAFMNRTDDELGDWGAGVIESICPELAGHRDLTLVSRWPFTAYLPTPGFWRRTSDLHRALPADSRVQLAGALFGCAGMEAAIRWGEHAADRLIEIGPTGPRDPGRLGTRVHN